MRTVLIILRKEFTQILRNRVMLPMIILVPIIQMLVLVNAATLEMKHIDLLVIDRDLSQSSLRLQGHFEGSPFFRLVPGSFSPADAEHQLIRETADIVIVIPQGFEEEVYRSMLHGVMDPEARLQLRINAVNATAAGLIQAYATQVLRHFANGMAAELGPLAAGTAQIDILTSFWYNPDLNYKVFMVPGILVILVTIMGLFLTALNLVREKEIGTIEQINVTPILKYQFIIGKLLPFWIIALVELAFGLALGWLLFRVGIEGSLWVLFSFTSLYLLSVLGLGLLMSSLSTNQQQVMFMTFFFAITFILMSGIFTPTESMPDWAQRVNVINPIAYYMRVIRMVMLKGSGFADIGAEFLAMGIYGVAAISLAVWRYRKTA